MLGKALLVALGLVAFVKLVLRISFREFGRRLDRAVNVALVLIVVAYVAQVVWWALRGS